MKIPIKRYTRDESLPIEEQYRQLEAHHEEETTFLVPRAFDDKELGLMLGSLTSFSLILANPEAAQAAGYVPPCFSAREGAQERVEELLGRIRKLFMT